MITKQELEKCIKAERTAALVVNTHSRKGERLFVQALDRLTARGISLVASSPVKDPAFLLLFMSGVQGRIFSSLGAVSALG
ncbi:MAG TPA: hypothetical protein VGX03_20665 [Candidatus Binatia bacterium]|jgi:hypothetical protein|nr:hypothetical protein [Candidatus Binatia bacterium]